METTIENSRDVALLVNIENDPNVTQASLATQLGVAVGTVNWHIKRLVEKGLLKLERAERKKLRYIITPEGLAFRASLTVDFIEQQFLLYRNTRARVTRQLDEVRQAGFDRVRIVGSGDVADICRLTCLEHGVTVVPEGSVPALVISGLKVILEMEKVNA